MEHQQQECDAIIDKTFEKMRQQYLSDPDLRRKHLSYRLRKVYERYVRAALDESDSNSVLIGKHFSCAFIECCSRHSISLMDNLHLAMANNPQEAKKGSPFRKRYGKEMNKMIKECNRIAERLKDSDFNDYLLYRQEWWDTEGGYNYDYMVGLFSGECLTDETIKSHIEAIVIRARERLQHMRNKTRKY